MRNRWDRDDFPGVSWLFLILFVLLGVGSVFWQMQLWKWCDEGSTAACMMLLSGR